MLDQCAGSAVPEVIAVRAEVAEQRGRVFYGWWLVGVGLVTLGVSTGTVMFAYSVLVIPLEREFQATRMAMMWGVSLSSVASAVASLWFGPLADRGSIRGMMAVGAVLLAAGLSALSFTSAAWQVALSYVLFMGFAQVLLGPLTSSTLVARWFNRRRGLALGVLALGSGFGGFLLPPLLQYLIAALGWRVACRVLALMVLVVTLPPVWLLIVNRPDEKRLAPDGGTQREAEAGARGPLTPPLTVSAILHRPDFWLVAVAVGVLFATHTALLSNLAPYAVGQGLTASAAATLVSTVALVGMAGTLLFGLVADRMDLRLALATAMALQGVALVLFRHGGFAWELRVGSGILGLAAGAAFPIWGTILGQAFGPLNYGRVMGLMDPLMITPLILVSSPLAGHLFDVTGNYRAVFDMFLVALVFAGLLLTQLQPIRKPDRVSSR